MRRLHVRVSLDLHANRYVYAGTTKGYGAKVGEVYAHPKSGKWIAYLHLIDRFYEFDTLLELKREIKEIVHEVFQDLAGMPFAIGGKNL